MRLHISLDIDRPTAIPLNYGHLLTGVVLLHPQPARLGEACHGPGEDDDRHVL